MGTFYKHIGGPSPSISQEKIIEFLNGAKFHKIDIDDAVISTEFFKKFRNMYNCAPVFSKYTAAAVEKLKQCFDWLGSEVYKNGNIIEGYKHAHLQETMGFDFPSYKINAVVFALLHNESLNPIRTVEGEIDFSILSAEYRDASRFEKIEFTSVSPYLLDGELAEIALEGSVYKTWTDDAMATKATTMEFVNKIMEGRFNDFKIYRTREYWGELALIS